MEELSQEEIPYHHQLPKDKLANSRQVNPQCAKKKHNNSEDIGHTKEKLANPQYSVDFLAGPFVLTDKLDKFPIQKPEDCELSVEKMDCYECPVYAVKDLKSNMDVQSNLQDQMKNVAEQKTTQPD